MQMPSATLMHAVATWLSKSLPIANGAAAPHTVAKPMIQPKNARGLGVATASPVRHPGGYQGKDERGDRVVETERVGHVEQQGGPDQGDIQDVLADHHTGDRDQGRDACGGQAATPQSARVDRDAGSVRISPDARVRHDYLSNRRPVRQRRNEHPRTARALGTARQCGLVSRRARVPEPTCHPARTLAFWAANSASVSTPAARSSPSFFNSSSGSNALGAAGGAGAY